MAKKATAKTQTILQCCGDWVSVDECTVFSEDPGGAWSMGPMECTKCGTLYDLNALPPEAISADLGDVDSPPDDGDVSLGLN